MKVVVQNGAKHCLSRKDAESMVRLFPSSWSSIVTQVMLAAGDSLTTSFHRKERVICLYSPPSPPAERDKAKAASVLVRSIATAVGAEVSPELELACVKAVGAGPA